MWFIEFCFRGWLYNKLLDDAKMTWYQVVAMLTQEAGASTDHVLFVDALFARLQKRSPGNPDLARDLVAI